MSDIYHAIRDFTAKNDSTTLRCRACSALGTAAAVRCGRVDALRCGCACSMADAERLTMSVGCSTTQLEETLKAYSNLGVWQVAADRSGITFVW